MAKPKTYYKEFFGVMNNDQHLLRDQVDVRRMPPYYVHRKISEALQHRVKELEYEKDRKFRTTLSDHVLYVILCDTKKKQRDEDKPAEDDKEEDEVEQQPEAPVEQTGVTITTVDDQVDTKKKKEPKNVFDKSSPFNGNTPLLVHRMLHEHNYEYAFFANEAGTKEIGVFIVLIEALTYKS